MDFVYVIGIGALIWIAFGLLIKGMFAYALCAALASQSLLAFAATMEAIQVEDYSRALAPGVGWILTGALAAGIVVLKRMKLGTTSTTTEATQSQA